LSPSKWIVVLALLATAAVVAGVTMWRGWQRSPPAERVAAEAFGQDPLWDDGKAEFSTYTGTTERYGKPRPTRASIIVVKEDLVRATLVKSDPGPVPGRTLEALKLNFIADFPTGTYSYHQMATLFFDRTSLVVLKESMSSTEGCGITFVRLGPARGGAGTFEQQAHSYWDGEADRATPIRWTADRRPRLFWDALPVSLRTLVARRGAYEVAVWLLPSQVDGRSPIASARPVEARVRVSDGGTIVVPAGSFETRLAEVTSPSGTDRFWFERRFPHTLVQLESAAGRRLLLARTQRIDYWNHRDPGDEKLVE
jgi:hypothetical protein